MRRLLSFATASALALLAFAAAPANADQTFTGTITGSEPIIHILQPDHATQACSFPGGGSADVPADTVNLTAQVAGNRRFAVTTPTIPGGGSVIYVYRNDTCVGADYQPDTPEEASANLVDVEGIPFAAGDRIKVVIALFAPASWTLTVQQPEPVKGAAKAAAVGKGARFVSLPSSISCASHAASFKLTKKFKRQAVKAVIRANGRKVKQVRTFKRRPVVVRNLPATTTTLSAVVTLKNGKKVSVQRSYWAC